MKNKGKIINIENRRICLVKGRFDYFDENNFLRLINEYENAQKQNAEFYVGLYSDEVLERTGHTRKLKGKVTNQDRVFMLESLDFVNGAFIINSLDKNIIKSELEAKLYEQNSQSKLNINTDKKYKVGYTSGAFSNLHKGHLEHLREMSNQCQTVIVAANSDRLIREYKNKQCTVDEETRRLILSHIKYVDMAIITDEYDKLKAIEKVKNLCGEQFNAIFVGSDWKGDSKWDKFKERFDAMGIDVIFTDRPRNGISSTEIDKTK